jgi:hypothetical protein
LDSNRDLKPEDVAQVHHAIPQKAATLGILSLQELNSIENLRGIPPGMSTTHLSNIGDFWREFWTKNPHPTKDNLIAEATKIDRMLGDQFVPKVAGCR